MASTLRPAAGESVSDPRLPGTPLSSECSMPDDARAHRAGFPKNARPEHPDETFGSRAPCPRVPCRAHPTSQKSLLHFSKSQNPPRGKIGPALHRTDPMPAIPRPAERLKRPTNCCRSYFARPRRDSESSAVCSRRGRAPPASAFRHPRHPDAPPPASAAPSYRAAAVPIATQPRPHLAESPPERPGTAVRADPHRGHHGKRQ